jgi:autotransporter-associated beta strand protein
MKRTSLITTTLIALSAIALGSLSGFAATPTTWTGGSATTANWSDTGNWSAGVPAGGVVVHFAGNTRLTINDDGPSTGNYSDLYFDSGAGSFVINQAGTAQYGLNGNLYNLSLNPQTINIAMQNIFGAPGGKRTFTLTNGSSLVISGVISQLSGAVNSFNLTGTGTTPYGTLTLSGANTFSGGLTNNNCTLNINNAQALGTAGAFGINTGSIINNTSGGSITTVSYPQFWNGSFTFAGANNLNLGTGAVALEANITVTANANTLTVGGIISGAYKLTKAGAGTLQLGGANTYTGDTTVSAGTLQMGAAGVMPNGAGYGNLSLTGTLDLNTFSQTINGLSGSGTVDTLSGGSPVLTVGNNNQTITFGGAIKNTAGTLGLTKIGNGTLTLTGVQTYGGATTVSAGVLAVSTGGSCANSAVSVGASSTFGVTVASAGGQWTCAGLAYTAASAVQQFGFAFLAPSTTTAPLQVNGNLAFTATPTFQILSGAFTAGSAYPLIQYTGSPSGTAPTTITMPPHMTGSISNDVIGKTIWLVVTSVTQPLDWATSSGTWDINTTANWKDTTGASTTYLEPAPPGDAVMFEDTVSGASPITVTLNSPVSPASVIASNFTKAYTLSGTGAIAGSGGLTKNGTNTLTLNTTNSYTGATIINGGALVVSNLITNGTNSALGAGTSVVLNGGTLKYTGAACSGFTRNITLNSGGGTLDDRSAGGYLFVGGIISGTAGGALTNTSVQIIVTNNNTYDGITYITGGQTQIRHANALGSTAGKTVVASGAQLAAGGGFVGTVNENIDLNGTSTSGALASYDLNTAVTFAGIINLATDSSISGSNNFAFTGPIVGSGALVKFGIITNTLSGTNTYTGRTTISSGTLALSLPAGATSSLSNSPVIAVAAAGVFDVSRVTSGFMLAAGQTLTGGGVVTGAVTVANSLTASIHPSGGGTNATTLGFKNNLTFAGSSAQAIFDLSSTYNGSNDKVALNNATLVCGGAQVSINCGAALDTTQDYVLFDAGASGTIPDSFNPTPAWSGTTPKYASGYSVVVSGTQVLLHYTKIPVTVASGLTANSKPYDGTPTATLTANSVVLAGLVDGDVATVALSLSDYTAVFASANAAPGQAVTVGGLTLTGGAAGNYTLIQPSLQADITPIPAAVATGLTANNKGYDGTATATLSANNVTLSGILSADVANATLSTNGYAAAFASASPGTSLGVTVSGLTLTGSAAGNYTLAQPTLSATITAAAASIASGLTANNKVYDGTSAATLSANNVSLSGILSADAANVSLSTNGYTATFVSASLGTGLAVTVGGLTLTGSAAGNYLLSQPAGLHADIAAVALTVTGITAENKVYDGTTNATLVLSNAVLVGVVNSDAVTLDTTNAAGAFADAAVETNKTVTVSGLALAGANAGNYTLTQPATSADITVASTTNALTSTTSVAQLGDTVTFTATVSAVAPGAGLPTGAVQFLTNGVPADAPVALTSGVATYSASLSAGANLVEAQYSGDANFLGSTNTLSQAVNSPPVAGNTNAGTTENQALVLGTDKLLPLCSDPDGDALSIISAGPTSTNGGTASLTGSTITYQPVTGFIGTDMFNYVVGDGRGGTATGSVVVTVTSASAPPCDIVSGPEILGNGHFHIVFAGIPGYRYTIRYSPNANGPWTGLTNLTAGAQGLFDLEDPTDPAPPMRFYNVTYP